MKQALRTLDEKSNETLILDVSDIEDLGFNRETARKLRDEILSCPIGMGDWDIIKVGQRNFNKVFVSVFIIIRLIITNVEHICFDRVPLHGHVTVETSPISKTVIVRSRQ